MSCKPCQRCFVQVADLLSTLKNEKLSREAEAKARTLAVTLMVIGELLTTREIDELKSNHNPL